MLWLFGCRIARNLILTLRYYDGEMIVDEEKTKSMSEAFVSQEEFAKFAPCLI